MDPAMAREMAMMMADLGPEHRDEVSAPGQNKVRNDVDHFEQRDLARRTKAHNQANADGGNTKHAKISNWNIQENFGSEAIVASLTNRFSGQGHREELISRNPQNPQEQYKAQRGGFSGGSGARGLAAHAAPTPTARTTSGGGRGGHVQGGGSTRGTYTSSSRGGLAATASPPQPPARTQLSIPPGLPTPAKVKVGQASDASSSLPLTSTQTQAPPVQVAPATTAAPVPTRTPIRIPVTSAGASAPPPRMPRTAATSTSTPAVRTNGTQAVPSVRFSATGASPYTGNGSSSPAGGVRGSVTGTATIIRVPHTTQTPQSPAVQPVVPVQPDQTARQVAKAPMRDHFREIAYVKMAEYYARNPGPKCVKYYEMFPERCSYLDQALKELGDEQKAAEKKGPVEEMKENTKVIKGEHDKNTAKQAVNDDIVKEEPAKKTIKKKTAEEVPQDPPAANEAGVQDSASSADCSPRSTTTVATDSTASSAASPPAPAPPELPAYGKLVATFLDADSNHLSTLTLKINAPVEANLTITSKAAAYDPRALSATVQTVARMMSLHDTSIRLERGDDGLWREVAGQDDE